MTELKPCPECKAKAEYGQSPKVEEIPTFAWIHSWVKCTNPDCGFTIANGIPELQWNALPREA